MYQTEYEENAIQRMYTLPMKESKIFFTKFVLMAVMCIGVLAIEALSIVFCTIYWFETPAGFVLDIFKNFSYSFLLMMPSALLILLISGACKNMWISLGIGVVCVFTATILPANNFVLSLFPFAMPFHTLIEAAGNTVANLRIPALIEIVLIGIAEIAFIKVRRSFE